MPIPTLPLALKDIIVLDAAPVPVSDKAISSCVLGSLPLSVYLPNLKSTTFGYDCPLTPFLIRLNTASVAEGVSPPLLV